MEAHPLRLHEEHGTLLSHFNLSLQQNEGVAERWEKETDRLHSAQAMAPWARFHSRSLYLVAFAPSLRPEGGMNHCGSPPRPGKYGPEANGNVQVGR
jgi:hypothetical protein